jgi:ribosomal protein L16 Arg81 hydroxylase
VEIKFEKNYCPNLFSWKELETIVNIKPLMNRERVHVLDSPLVSWRNDDWTVDPNTYPSSLLRSLMDNHICYFIEMSRCSEKINDFAHKIELQYGSSVDAHIYMCRNSSIIHPFGIHYDYSNNIIVQCEGTTNFKVWDTIINETKESERANLKMSKTPFLDIEMVPGDAIFIPEYVPHLAESKTPRLSVSFPFRSRKAEYLQDRTWIKF